MKRYLSAMLVLITIVVTFSGCFPTGEKQQTETDLEEYKVGEKFEYSKDNLTAEFTIPEKLPQATRIGIKPKAFDREEVIKLFFGDKAYTEGLESEGMLGTYETDDGSFFISFYGGGLSFYDNRVCNYEYPVNYGSLVNYCVPRVWDYNPPSDNELKDFPRETALNSAEELLKKLGIVNFGEPEVYPMSVEAIKRVVEEQSLSRYDIQKLSQEHECYVLRYSQLFDGTGMAPLPVSIGRTGYNDPTITLVLTREGVVYFKAELPLENDFEVLSREPVKYGLNYALSEFKRFHDAAYLDNGTIIYDFKPAYYPELIDESGTFEFILMWTFEGRIVHREEDYTNRSRYVAAIRSDDGIVKTYKGG